MSWAADDSGGVAEKICDNEKVTLAYIALVSMKFGTLGPIHIEPADGDWDDAIDALYDLPDDLAAVGTVQ